TSMSVMRQARSVSFWPSRIRRTMCSSKRPVSSKSAMMMGLDVAPVAPQARLRDTSVGSIESSHSLVPERTSDSNGVMVTSPIQANPGGPPSPRVILWIGEPANCRSRALRHGKAVAHLAAVDPHFLEDRQVDLAIVNVLAEDLQFLDRGHALAT